MMKLHRFLYWLFWKKLCPRPDWGAGTWLEKHRASWYAMWVYNITGRIASYFHRKVCPTCKERA